MLYRCFLNLASRIYEILVTKSGFISRMLLFKPNQMLCFITWYTRPLIICYCFVYRFWDRDIRHPELWHGKLSHFVCVVYGRTKRWRNWHTHCNPVWRGTIHNHKLNSCKGMKLFYSVFVFLILCLLLHYLSFLFLPSLLLLVIISSPSTCSTYKLLFVLLMFFYFFHRHSSSSSSSSSSSFSFSSSIASFFFFCFFFCLF